MKLIEISEEYNKQNRLNVLNFLEKIKDLAYEDKSKMSKLLVHTNKEENIKIIISFNYNNIINKINVYDTSIGWDGENIIHIITGLNTKGVKKISEELCNKYFGEKK